MQLQILVVEDNADTRQLLTLLLQDRGDPVRAVSTIDAALHEYAGSPVDLLISDLGLPDGSGIDLMHQLRHQGEAPYAIAVSGYGTASDVAMSLAAGFRHHLLKPIDIGELERLVELARTEVRARMA